MHMLREMDDWLSNYVTVAKPAEQPIDEASATVEVLEAVPAKL